MSGQLISFSMRTTFVELYIIRYTPGIHFICPDRLIFRSKIQI